MGGNPHRRWAGRAALWRGKSVTGTETGISPMFAIVAFIALAIIAVIVLTAVMHLLFSPLVLLVVLGVLAWVKLGPRRSRR